MRHLRLIAVSLSLVIGLGCGLSLNAAEAQTPTTNEKELKEGLAALPEPSVTTIGDRTVYTYYLFLPLVKQSYPSSEMLPEKYQSIYPDIGSTVLHFTQQSLTRDGYHDADVQVNCKQVERCEIRIISSDPSVAGYSKVHPAFIDPAHGLQAHEGSANCKACTDCSDDTCKTMCGSHAQKCWGQNSSHVHGDVPWAEFLPLGLPMLNQKTVLFLDYPPITALEEKDYLSNFTMCRWNRVMGATGASNPDLYAAIVDSRPIAAAGSGMDRYLPNALQTYNTNNPPTGEGTYLTPMLQLLTNPKGTSGPATLPVAVFGGTAIETWGEMVNKGHKPHVLDVGTAHIGGQPATTAWIATNHPDVTSYNCCKDSPYSRCKPNRYGSNQELVKDEQTDFVTACWLQTMAANPNMSPEDAKRTCVARWMPPTADADKLSQCIEEKLDSNNPDAVCCSWKQAWAWCKVNSNNACAA